MQYSEKLTFVTSMLPVIITGNGGIIVYKTKISPYYSSITGVPSVFIVTGVPSVFIVLPK
jgi:hypothetical protein